MATEPLVERQGREGYRPTRRAGDEPADPGGDVGGQAGREEDVSERVRPRVRNPPTGKRSTTSPVIAAAEDFQVGPRRDVHPELRLGETWVPW